ncbi:MAG: GSU2403 family nucleotidyltransferase fold protein [Elusimicrobiales bacterium]|nr:GSU2403 family nucleotidyltransferase fold protein [Elusimicrobiales bacterium]
MRQIPLETQTLQAELLEQLIALEARRSIGHLKGSFTTKTIKSAQYCYFQHIDLSGVKQQFYIGRKSPQLDKLVARFEAEKSLFEPDANHIKRLCAQLRVGGVMATDAAIARVIKSFSDSGLFRLGGVLVGTHAFTVLGNMLGVNWETHIKTQDIDIASPKNIDFAVPGEKTDIPATLEKLEMGFLPVPALSPKNPSTSFMVRGKTLIVDILTTARHESGGKFVFIPRLNTTAMPLKYMDYLIEDTVQGAVVNGDGILVNIPTPARFALHKLIVSQERGASQHAKTLKDVAQAASLFSILSDERSGDILLAWEALQKRGKNWISKAKKGYILMQTKYPQESAKLAGVIQEIAGK